MSVVQHQIIGYGIISESIEVPERFEDKSDYYEYLSDKYSYRVRRDDNIQFISDMDDDFQFFGIVIDECNDRDCDSLSTSSFSTIMNRIDTKQKEHVDQLYELDFVRNENSIYDFYILNYYS